ncbi:MAG: hypothetical protein ACYC96_07965 [Fimbriimonadaceae bacterium]
MPDRPPEPTQIDKGAAQLPDDGAMSALDGTDRLKSSSIPTSSTTTVSSTFGFDSGGNRSSVNGTSVPFNADDQLSAPGNWFDGAGNPGSYGGSYFTSDPESGLTAFDSSSTVTATYRAGDLSSVGSGVAMRRGAGCMAGFRAT